MSSQAVFNNVVDNVLHCQCIAWFSGIMGSAMRFSNAHARSSMCFRLLFIKGCILHTQWWAPGFCISFSQNILLLTEIQKIRESNKVLKKKYKNLGQTRIHPFEYFVQKLFKLFEIWTKIWYKPKSTFSLGLLLQDRLAGCRGLIPAEWYTYMVGSIISILTLADSMICDLT